MAERVHTGGLMSFGDPRNRKLSEQERRSIQDGYRRYYERREREKKIRMLKWGAVIFLSLALLAYFLFLKFY